MDLIYMNRSKEDIGVLNSNSFDIGDVVGAKDNETGMFGTAEITKKIVKIENNSTTISYKVGEK